MCSRAVLDRLQALLMRCQLPTEVSSPLAVEAILDGMALDKKITDGQWVFILPKKIGAADMTKGVDRLAIKNLLERQVPQLD